ncbi:uncharacterized protein RHOBADRAFT_18810 [Rhodotorula graminis WP1]|uniref:Uracil-DNA glycosylase-like domain-containing protein n=1 Tax=Rhodotorula graminis (strain WP1) TaxID=578459 RepID=A0A0N8PZB3_RHOGW|nr:uncharacterized protein RHOBADRAFT_18810 [Rhodotorula graminis WP1]KPV71845.1 hypothetical protein RHOBADRAFT_18810 [Rhodotorula graminis WP1]
MQHSARPSAAHAPDTALRRSSRHSSNATLLSLESPLRPAKRRNTGTQKLESKSKVKTGEPTAKKPRSKGPYSHLGAAPLSDRIQDGLDVLFCGENPGIRTAELQLHYASPANHFYKCLHAARLTPSVLSPESSRTLPEDYNIGITNLIERPTREASELGKDELEAAVPGLLAKVARYRPKLVAFVGIKVCETVLRYLASPPAPPPPPTASSGRKANKTPLVKAQIGLQGFAIAHLPSTSHDKKRPVTYFYCLPSTSGRVAAYPVRSSSLARAPRDRP